MLKKLALGALALVVLLAVGGFAAFQLSPWPHVLLIRNAFKDSDEQTEAALAARVPPGVEAQSALHYDPGNRDALLDVFYPAEAVRTDAQLPTLIWVHGGGWVGGSREGVLANYLQIIAARGYTTVGVDYSIAPGATYPTPLRQLNEAIGYLRQEAARLHIDPGRIFLAGDSAGAQIVAQYALIATDPAYAREMEITPAIERPALRGLVLHCGPYDTSNLNFDGPFGGFMRTVLWSYIGDKNFIDNPALAQLSVPQHLSANYPPFFISVGNADPLAPHSQRLVAAAEAHGVAADTLFFPDDYTPALGHEYQMNLDTEAGRLALDRSVAFLAAQSPPAQ